MSEASQETVTGRALRLLAEHRAAEAQTLAQQAQEAAAQAMQHAAANFSRVTAIPTHAVTMRLPGAGSHYALDVDGYHLTTTGEADAPVTVTGIARHLTAQSGVPVNERRVRTLLEWAEFLEGHAPIPPHLTVISNGYVLRAETP